MRRGAVLLVTAAVLAGPLSGQDLTDARAALRTGEYADAVRAYRKALRSAPESAEARIGLIEALSSTGDYDEAIEVGGAAPAAPGVAVATGEVMVTVGRLEDAARLFESARDDPAWGLTAEADLADLAFLRGRVDEAVRRYDPFIDIYNDSDGQLSARDLVAVGRAVHFLGRENPDLFQDALRAFDQAARAEPGWAEPSVRAGELFLEKYSSPEAQAEFGKVLAVNPRHPGALLGLARALRFDGTSEAGRTLARLLEVNPNQIEAHALVAEADLTRERDAAARAEAEKGLAVNPKSLTALTALAGANFIAGDSTAFREVRRRVLALNPKYARLDATLAEIAVQTRRYEAAVERARAAVALDSAAWEAWGLLGMNELRLGRIEEGRADLERAFTGDPYNPWFKNSLDLLDTFDRFETRTTEHFELFLHGTEAELLATYLEPLAEEAYDSLSRRYGTEPPLPVRAELYPSHADFSVRTLGEAGLGALGVSFGSVLVMDSPGARERGDYNWASVFWHELSHTFHLAMSEHRVPRWFSEGLAVHEQRRARPGWGHQATIPFLQALRDGRLKKVSELNDGFMRPDFPEQVLFSYYEASLVFQVIEERYGFDSVRAMLEGYRRGESTEQLFDSVLGISLDDFDADFEGYLKERFASPLRGLAELGEAPPRGADIDALEDFTRAHPGDLIGRIRVGAALVREGRYDEAEGHMRAALRIFPEYGGPDSPYWYLAQIHRARGEPERAVAALDRLNGLSESNFAALNMQAEILEELGRAPEAAAALDKAVQVWPYDIELHSRLATLHSLAGDPAGAVRERRAVVALDPVDRAEALYLLAIAYRDAGDRAHARRSVLRALDIAPNYDAALELLLELRSGTREGAE
jgi:tetratricopeptide (TPR) repeat protein